MKVLLFLSLCAAAAFADKWPNLKTTFGTPITPHAYESQPRTRDEAIEFGYSKVSADYGCADGPYLGEAYADPDEPSFVVLFDEAGYVAGVRSVVLASAIDLSVTHVDQSPWYVQDTFFGQDAWYLTAYFVDPNLICNGGRTAEQWEEQGTGDRFWVQIGSTQDTFVKAPLTEAEFDGEGFDNWYRHYCFVGMGQHYTENNYDVNQNCDDFLPMHLLYDGGVLTGFVMAHQASLPGHRWEKPNKWAIRNIINTPPTCMLDAVDSPGLVTLHHFFYNHPSLTLCL